MFAAVPLSVAEVKQDCTVSYILFASDETTKVIGMDGF